jgi:hypothetical protein
MNKQFLIGTIVIIVALAAVWAYVTYEPSEAEIAALNQNDVQTVVEAFGTRMQSVALLSPQVSDDLARQYGDLVEPSLLSAWKNNPQSAPGRVTSSPWPDHVAVTAVTRQPDGSYQVQGDVVEMTSTGEAGEEPVTFTVSKQNKSWLITAVSVASTSSQ